MSLATYQTQTTSTPQSAFDRLALARELFQKFHTQCFWYSPRELDITEELIAFVVKGLSTHGGRLGFILAEKLLPNSFDRDATACR